MNICMSSYAGDLASKNLYKSNEAAVRERFSGTFALKIEELLDKEEAISYEASLSEVHLRIEEGVYQTLWRLGEALGVGLEVEHKLIPIKQETIEICELFEINPYEIESSGHIYVLPEGELPHEGVLIGKTTHTNDRIIIMKSGNRFLNKN